MPANATNLDVAKRAAAILDASSSFLGFFRSLNPTFDIPPFQLEFIDVLNKLENGTLGKRRLLITMPPRHGKSSIATIHFPAYYIAKKPNREVLSTSYNAELSKTFGRQVRNLAAEPLIHQAYPDFEISKEASAADDWMTTANGRYFATGIGGGTPGRAANLLLVDDPIKARREAESATYRNHFWSYYISALLNRKQPEVDGTLPIEIMILTRWHPDDPAGRIMETEDWKDGDWYHLNFDAYQERKTDAKISRTALPKDDPDWLPSGGLRNISPGKRHVNRMVRDALWPARFPLAELNKIERRDLREFTALYRQQPYIQGGNMIKASWFQAADKDASIVASIVSADTAFKKTEQADYSVLMHMGLTASGDIYILDVLRKKLDFPELKRVAITYNARHRGSGLRGFYIEDKASGQSLIQELRNESGIAVIPYKPGSLDKVTRASVVMPLIEGGRVFLPLEAPWLDDFIHEIETFPAGTHDDQVDALTMGLDILSKMGAALGPSAWSSSLASNPHALIKSSLAAQYQGDSLTTTLLSSRWGE